MALYYKNDDPGTSFNYDEYPPSDSESPVTEPSLNLATKFSKTQAYPFGCKFLDPWFKRVDPTLNVAASRVFREIRKRLEVQTRYIENNCDFHLQVTFKLCGYDMEYEQRVNAETDHSIWETSSGEFAEVPQVWARLMADGQDCIFEHKVFFDRGLEVTHAAESESLGMLFGSDHVSMIGATNLWRFLGLICFEEKIAWTQKMLPFHLEGIDDLMVEELD